MISKVEELRKELNADLGACHLALFRDDKGVTESIDSLISAAHAEGVAEGAEQMVNQIKSNGGQYTQKGDAVMSDYLIQCPGLAARAGVDLFIVPASVLAPTKKKP